MYEPVEEGSYIKMIDMVSGNGGQIQVSDLTSVGMFPIHIWLDFLVIPTDYAVYLSYI